MKKVSIILIVVLNIFACTFSQKPTEKAKSKYKSLNELLERDNYIIPDSLFSFFPDKSNKYIDLDIIFIFANAEKDESGIPLLLSEFDASKIIELYECKDKDKLQKSINEYRSQSIFSVKSESNDYFIIGSERDLLEEYDTLQLTEHYANFSNKPIVYYFREAFKENDLPFIYDTTTINGLPFGYEILVLRSGNDFVLPQDHLYEWQILPENLKHGYRSGVAFKEEEPYIIYWAVAW